MAQILALTLVAIMNALLAAAAENPQPDKPMTGETAPLSAKQDELQKRGCVSGLTLAQARELLDWLENHGCVGFEVSYQEEAGFTVRFPTPAPQ